MEKRGGICYRCKFFERYYTKTLTEFKPEKLGWCYKKGENVVSVEVCENYKTKLKKRGINGRAKKRINDFLMQLKAIRQFLEAEQRENDEQENM